MKVFKVDKIILKYKFLFISAAIGLVDFRIKEVLWYIK